MTDLPSYSDLRPAPLGGRSAWGLFGSADNLGLVNLMTPEKIAAAARLVRKGQVFPLDLPLGSIAPALATYRGEPRHQVLHRAGTIGFDDVYDNFYPQASSQWDSLAHIGYAPDEFYNGATEDEIIAGTRNTIDHWARHGMAGRAVVLDVERAMREAGRHYHPGESIALGVEELELARRQAGAEFAAGDTILLRVPVEHPCGGHLLGHVRRGDVSGRYESARAPDPVLAPDAHRPVRDGARGTVVAQGSRGRLRGRRRLRGVSRQRPAERTRRDRLPRERCRHQVGAGLPRRAGRRRPPGRGAAAGDAG